MADELKRMQESTETYEAYRRYLRLGRGRSLASLREALIEEWGEASAPSVRALEEWSRKLMWQDRLVADEELIYEKVMDRERDRIAKAAEQRRDTRLATEDLVLAQVQRALMDDHQRPNEELFLTMEPARIRAIIMGMRLAMEGQRLDMGEATVRQDVTSGDDVVTHIYLPEQFPPPDAGPGPGLLPSDRGADLPPPE